MDDGVNTPVGYSTTGAGTLMMGYIQQQGKQGLVQGIMGYVPHQKTVQLGLVHGMMGNIPQQGTVQQGLLHG